MKEHELENVHRISLYGNKIYLNCKKNHVYTYGSESLSFLNCAMEHFVMIYVEWIEVMKMKRIILLSVAVLVLIAAATGCVGTSGNIIEEGPFTNDNRNDFAGNKSVKINNDMLDACYRYADDKGYEIKNKKEYRGVLLGESLVASVYTENENDRGLVDENDYLIIFEEIRVIVDADTGKVLGNIPYV